MIQYNDILLTLISALGGVILILIYQVLASVKEVKEEIRILRQLENRISSLEEFKAHFKECKNFTR